MNPRQVPNKIKNLCWRLHFWTVDRAVLHRQALNLCVTAVSVDESILLCFGPSADDHISRTWVMTNSSNAEC